MSVGVNYCVSVKYYILATGEDVICQFVSSLLGDKSSQNKSSHNT